ncbi:hypothetical protein CH330_06155 [candidate division WOR-3 bacterium JGI_Cruoil_03_51_56]|uniref:Thiamine-phosphate synthase ThiN domain-containing protein n=1 Tax=candidate division WOR-3 bacterium JGI_Cruoil_03_51_56 TaxID=1973747 RepID=A0A235BST7_UNCW3|nr:MAG: hypothetical protein CH330_06155 [candidate division WOR-3 bacterium JGI_Cruoil_03_51_56]
MTQEQRQVIDRLKQAVSLLEACSEFSALVPEVRTNFVYALADAKTASDIAGVDGRITVVEGMPKASGPVRFGVSDHLARRIIEFRKYDKTIRSALNFRWNETILEFIQADCKEKRLELGVVDRKEEPKELIGKDKGSMSWKVKQLVESCGGKIPPVFYETRGWGKEPLFILVGSDPLELAEQAIDIASGFTCRKL